MLRLLTRMRRRVGRLLALAYLVCVIAPPMALALAEGAVAAHCLTDDHHVAVVAHVHADSTVHHHVKKPDHPAQHAPQPASHHKQADSEGKAAPGNCCGLFCMNATATDVGVPIGVPSRASILMPTLEAALGGLAPSRIDRPPIDLLSL